MAPCSSPGCRGTHCRRNSHLGSPRRTCSSSGRKLRWRMRGTSGTWRRGVRRSARSRTPASSCNHRPRCTAESRRSRRRPGEHCRRRPRGRCTRCLHRTANLPCRRAPSCRCKSVRATSAPDRRNHRGTPDSRCSCDTTRRAQRHDRETSRQRRPDRERRRRRRERTPAHPSKRHRRMRQRQPTTPLAMSRQASSCRTPHATIMPVTARCWRAGSLRSSTGIGSEPAADATLPP